MSQPLPPLDTPLQPDQFLVCGLGSVGQHCVAILKDFGVIVHGIEHTLPQEWEIPQVPQFLTSLIIGDCRHTETLEQAQIRHCRAALLVTADERINIEAGLAARSLNPQVRLVVRSAKENLNQLLEHQLGNYVSFEPTQLSAPAFAFAALNSETLGFFNIDQFLFQVVQHSIPPQHRWLTRSGLHDLNNRYRRVLTCVAPDDRETGDASAVFYHWQPGQGIQVGDRITTIEVVQRDLSSSSNPNSPVSPPAQGVTDRRFPLSCWRQWKRQWRQHSQEQHLQEQHLQEQHLQEQHLQEQHLQEQHLQEQPWRQGGLHWLQTWLRTWLHTWLQHQLRGWRDRYQKQIWRVLFLCALTVLVLTLGGTLLFWRYYPHMTLTGALHATAVLLLGGYSDLFGDLDLVLPMPWGLRLLGLSLTLAGTAFVGVLYALLTERLLTLRFHFFSPRLPLPDQDHVIVIGLGRVGQRVVDLLQTFRQPVVAVTDGEVEERWRSRLPIVEGKIQQALEQVNLKTARSVVAVTDAEMDNLEVALMAQATNPDTGLVIRTYHRRFRDTVARLFPSTQVLCASELAAEAFAAAAFGENVVGLFRLQHQTIIVTDYRIETGDTLNGLLLAEVAYGYGVVPIYHERSRQQSPTPMPSEDLRLQVGDRMVVLATIQGLKWIEQGVMAPRRSQVQVQQALNADAIFQGANEIACISGCTMMEARTLMAQLPAQVPTVLYPHQAFRLVQKLRKVQVTAARIERVSPET